MTDTEMKVWECLVVKDLAIQSSVHIQVTEPGKTVFFKRVYKTKKCMAEEHRDKKKKSGLEQPLRARELD